MENYEYEQLRQEPQIEENQEPVIQEKQESIPQQET